MARTREMIRTLRNDLFFRLVGLPEVQEHPCDEFTIHTTECVICNLVQRGRGYSLALVKFLREAGVIPLYTTFIEEVTLLEIVGQQKYNRMVDAEVRAFLFGPILTCNKCNAKRKWLISRKHLSEYIQARRKIHFYCYDCDSNILVDTTSFSSMVKPKDRKNKKKYDPSLLHASNKLKELLNQE
jgi:hypothetical protein